MSTPTHTHKPTGRPCTILSTTAWSAVVDVGAEAENRYPRVHLHDLEPIADVQAEYTVETLNNVRTVIRKSDVFGLPGWRFACLTCRMQSALSPSQEKVEAAAKAHHCTRWGSGS